VWVTQSSKEHLKYALDGLELVERSEDEEERSSPSRH
jgi:hypothetical protein